MTESERRIRRVTVFCGSSAGSDPAHAECARVLGRELVKREVELVYGGGSIGLMGIVANEVLAAGGRVTGVIPRTLFVREVGHRGLTTIKIVDTMHERKAIMADLADAFISLPGAFGTLDETFEILTWAQLGIHAKPVVLVNVNGFWDPLLAMVDRMVEVGFLRHDNRSLINVARGSLDALDLIERWNPPTSAEKWLAPEQR